VIWPLLALTTVAAYFDIRTRKIPNWLSLAGITTGVALNATSQQGLKQTTLGILVGFALYFPLWLLGARGAGDVKLLAAAGSLIGPYNTLLLAILAAVTGGVLALALVLYRGALLQTTLNIGHILNSLIHLRRPGHTLLSPSAIRLPHALVIMLAAVILSGISNG
jgi:prepilin peptidase CpaA